jgi:hypothetical protein
MNSKQSRRRRRKSKRMVRKQQKRGKIPKRRKMGVTRDRPKGL